MLCNSVDNEGVVGIVGISGRSAEVDDGGLRANPRTAFEQAVVDGRAFAWAALNKDADANDTVLGVKNNSASDVLKIHKLLITSDAAGQFQVFTMPGITMAGTTEVVGTNLNGAFGRVALATAYTDETGQDAQGGNYANLAFRDTVVADVTKEVLVDGAITLSPNEMVGVDLTTASTTYANAVFIGWFEPR